VTPVPTRVALLAILIVLALPAAGAQGAAATSVAVGDSITNQTRDEILNRFYAAGWPGAVYGINSQRIDQMRPYIQKAAAAAPRLQRMFIFLGTNDAWQFYNGTQSLQASIQQLYGAVNDVTSVRPKACVFLVTIHDLYYRDEQVDTSRFHLAVTALNNEMRKIDSGSQKVFLIDWNQLSTGQDWFADFIGHLNQTGQDHLADFYRYFGTTASTASKPCGPSA
jgi:hypothetical protein